MPTRPGRNPARVPGTPSPKPAPRIPGAPKMPPGVHPFAAPRIPTPPFRMPPKPVFNPFKPKLPKGALGRLAGRLVPGLGLVLLAWDIYDSMETLQGSPGRKAGWLLGGTASCSLTCPGSPSIALGAGLNWGPGGDCPISQPSNCVSGQAVKVMADMPQSQIDAIWNASPKPTKIIEGIVHFKWGASSKMFNKTIHVYRPGMEPKSPPRYLPEAPPNFAPLDLLPMNIPGLDPNSMPIFVPVPTPHPIPVPLLPRLKPNPDRVPSERSDDGIVTKPDPWAPIPPVNPFPPEPAFPPNPEPGTGVKPKPPVDPFVPSVDLDTGAIGSSPRVTPRPGRHYKRPPGSNEREKKKNLNRGAFYRILNGLVGFVGEAGDFVDAVYDALPPKVRRWKGRDGKWRDRDANPITKAERIFNNLDKLDVDKAIENIIANQLEDKLIGSLASGARKDLARKGWTSDRNPFGTPSQMPGI